MKFNIESYDIFTDFYFKTSLANRVDFSKLLDEASNYFKDFKSEDTGNVGGSIGGTQSAYFGIQDKPIINTEYQKVLLESQEVINQLVSENKLNDLYISNSWYSITQPNEYVVPHPHPGAVLSGVFYAYTPKNNFNFIAFQRDLRFTDYMATVKKGELGKRYAANWTVPVSQGDLIIFPSYLVHSTDTNESEETRVSIAFNVKEKFINLN